MFHTKNKKGISLITLVITIVVIIILAFITLRLNGNPLDEASAVKFKQEITDVKRGVETIKLINAKQGLDEKTLNKNFKKVEVTNPPSNFVSFDDDKLTGYLVDLEEIDYQKLQTGQGYKEINEGGTVEFNVDDVYVYDKEGTVYYLKGAYLDGDEVYYTAEEKKLDGPTVTGENTEGGTIVIHVTPVNSGEITSVKVGDIEATKISDGVYEFEVDKNGSYIITATEKGSGTTKTKVNVTKIDDGTSIGATTAPTIAEIMINSGEIYTNEENATLTIKSDAELMYLKHVTDGSIPVIPAASSSGWRNTAESTQIVLREGVNEVWVWFRNKGNNAILSASASIMLDTDPPTRTKPTVEIFDEYSFRITANQKDTTSGLKKIEIGYKKVEATEYTWVEVPDVTNPTIEVPDNTPNQNYSIISRAEDNSGLTSESLDYMTGTLKGIPGGVVIDYNPKDGYTARSTVVITYPEESNSTLYEKWYRLDEGEWQVTSSMELTIYIEENTVIDAVVVRKTDIETVFGEITTAIVNNIDGTNPTIGYVDLNPMAAENGSDFKASVELADYETGVTQYAVIETEGTPSTWEILNRPMKTTTITFDANIGKIYYVWAKDEAGNVAKSVIEISAIDIIDPEMAVSIENTVYDYTGLEIKPKITVTYKGYELTEGTDFDVVYKNNINAGTATATVTGKNVYAGSLDLEYTILKIKPTITLENVTYLFTNTIQEIAPAKVTGAPDGATPSGKITYTYYKDAELTTTTSTADGATSECGAPSAEGTYYVIAQIEEDINYTSATSNIAIMSIQPRPIKITFDAAGGSENETERIVYFGKEYGTLPETDRAGYTFLGWYIPNGNKIEATSKVEIMEEHTITANWSAHKYTINYDGNGNTGGTTASSTHTYDIAKVLTANGYTKTGYTFNGWNTEADGTGTSYANNASVINLTTINNGVVTLYAQWGQNGYQIKYDGNGSTSGSMSNSSHVYDVEKALTTNTYEKTGYTFNGWNSKADGTGTSYTDKEVVKNLTANSNEVVTIYAQWVANKYTIKYDGNTSTAGSMSDTAHTYDVAQRLPVNTYEKTGYIFGGWNTKKDGTGTSFADNESVVNVTATNNEVVTLYAQWGEDNYTISYELNGGTVSGTNPTNYSITSATITLINPTKTGYTFAGWTGTDLTSATTTVTIPKGSIGNRTYTANWTAIEYTISYDLAGGTVSGTNPTKYTIESNTITLINPSRTGYTFTGWTGTDLSSATTTVTISKGSIGNRSYTATWEAIEYTITYDLDGGAISGNPTTYTVETNTITLINPLKTGYTFAGWTGTDLTAATMTVTIPKGSIGNRSYKATWTLNNYTITYDLDGGTLSGTNPTNYSVTSGAITLINPTKTGYTFAGWTGTDLTAATTTVTIPHGSTGNRSYTATWTLNTYTITYVLNDGTVSGTNPTTYTVESDVITLINPSKTGYTFGGWTGTGLSSATTTVTIPKGSTGDRTYTATWGANTYTISYDLAGGAVSGTNPTTYTIETSSFTLINPSKAGYTFTGWTGTGLSAVTKNVTISKGSTGNRSYTANWEGAVAIYSADDTSLTFYRANEIVEAGSIYNGKTATAVYTGFETTDYVSASKIPWNGYATVITTVTMEDTITPISTAYWFCEFKNATSIDLTKLDTSHVTNMSPMFSSAGYNSTTFELIGLENWDTSKVTDMNSMFYNAGYNASSFEIDLSKWNTSNVKSMYGMFSYTGYKATTWSVGDLSNWDTANVENITGMYSMFNYAGYSASTWDIGNLNNWKTSKVTDMRYMFAYAGYSATTWNIGDLSSWDTASVTDMSNMFYGAGYSATTWDIGDLSSWNTASVTNMRAMFCSAGYSATTWDIGDLSSWNTASVTDMSAMFYYVGYSATIWDIGDLSSWNTASVTNMHSMFRYAGYSATTWDIGDLSSWNTASVTNMHSIFRHAGYSATTWDIGDLSSWNTASVTNMSTMFHYAGYSATTWDIGDLSSWNTASVTDMSNMFYRAGVSATTWDIGDLSSWNTASVTDMSNMFCQAGYSANTFTLNLSKWNTSNVTNMSNMFDQCIKLSNLNLSGFSTVNVTNMSNMFRGMSNLQEITLGVNFAWVGTNGYLYAPSSSYIDGADGKWYNTSTGTGYAPSEIPSNTAATYVAYPPAKTYTVTFNANGGTVDGTTTTTRTLEEGMIFANAEGGFPVPVSSSGMFTGWYTTKSSGGTQILGGTVADDTVDGITLYARWATSGITAIYSETDNSLTFINAESVVAAGSTYNEKVVTETYAGFANTIFTEAVSIPWNARKDVVTSIVIEEAIAPTATAYWFADFSNATTIDVEILDASNITTTKYMFANCEAVARIYVWDWITTNVTDMSHMFENCKTLASLYLWIDTSKVTDMSYMLSGCTNLSSIGMNSSFVTTNVTNMEAMFKNCASRKTFSLTTFDTSKVTNMAYMFDGCAKTTTYDLSSFNTTNVTNMESMFTGNTVIETLDLSSFNTAKVTSMANMFKDCTALLSVDVTSFTTSKVTNMSNMFNGCSNVTNLDISSFNTSAVTTMQNMFNGCNKLQIVALGSGFKFVGTNGYLPTPSSTYISAADGKWYNVSTQVGYAASAIPNNTAATYSAIPAMTANVAIYSIDDNSLTFAKLNNAMLGSTYNGKTVTEVYTGFENAVYTLDEEALTVDTPWYGKASKIKLIEMKSTITPTSSTAYWFYNFTSLVSGDVSNLNTSSVTDMSNMFYNCKAMTNVDVSGFATTNVTNMSNMFYNCRALTTLDVSNFNTSKVTDMSYMFYYCRYLTALDVSGFTTTNVTNMSNMFYYCYQVPTLDVSGFNTAKVTDASNMFYYCRALTSLDVTGFNTSNMTNISGMFWDCAGLTSLNVTGFNTTKVTNMSRLFSGCTKVTSLDVTGFNTTNVTDMSYMFRSCYGITSLDVTKFNTSNVTNMSNMFAGCSFTTIDVTGFNTSNVTDMSGMFYFCSEMTTVDLTKFDTSKVTDMSQMFQQCLLMTSIDLTKFNTSNVTDMECMFYYCTDLPSLDVTKFNTSKVENFSGMFCRSELLTSINVTGFDTSSATDMSSMFNGCYDLTSLNVTGFDTSKVTNMYAMFKDCYALTSVNVTGFDTSSATRMDSMFEGCIAMTSIKTTGFDTTNVETTSAMFKNCDIVTSLDVSHFVMDNNEDISWMFSGCGTIKTITLGDWNTSNVTDMTRLFLNCDVVTSLDVSKLETEKVTDMSAMFTRCRKLATIDVSNFNTAKVKDMSSMFDACFTVRTLDVSSFDTSRVTDMTYMFDMYSDEFSESLRTVTLGSGWNTAKVTSMFAMFQYCGYVSLDCSSWDVTKVTEYTDFNDGAPSVIAPTWVN